MKKLLSLILSLLMVFSAMPLTMMASAATVTAAGYTFDWIRGSDGANDFNEVITPAGDALSTKNYDTTCMNTSRALVEGDKLAYTTKDSVAKGLYKVIFELRAYTGRADLNIKIGDRDYGKYVTPTSGGANYKETLFEDYVHAEDGPLAITFTALSAGSFYIEQLHLEKIEYEYTVDGTNATLTKYIGTGGDIEIPEKIDGYTVVGVGADCFKGCETLTSIKAYKNVASIGEGAFADCVGLEKITIDNGACEIFDSAETISETAVISGGNKSTAQAYAGKYGREFEMITFATIGGESYSSLAAAFEVAQDGDRIVLVKDVELTDSITTERSVVLDLAGHKIDALNATITTSKDFEIASTQDGLGEEYSKFEEAIPTAPDADYYTVANLPDSVNWISGYYNTNGVYGEYKTRCCLDKLVEVDPGQTYKISGLKDIYRLIVREYGADRKFTRSVGSISADTFKTSDNAYYISITVWNLGNDSGDTTIATKLADGTLKPALTGDTSSVAKGSISFGSAFVKTSANFKMSNIKATGSATGSFYEQTDANAMPKFTAYDCAFAVASTSVVRPLNFASNASKIDMQDCSVSLGNNNNGAGFSIESASVGTFKNVKFLMSTGMAVCISKTGAEGVTFEDCTITSSGDSGNCALDISGGIVNLKGGTIGNKYAGYNTKISGGNVTIDGTKFNDTKKTAAGVLNITGGTLLIKSCAIINATGKVTNDSAKLKESLAEGVVFYSSSTPAADTILSKDKDIESLKELYALPCEHYCVAKQQESENTNLCEYCSLETEISHDYSVYEYNETQHWGTCSTCGFVQEPVNHEIGENGTAATCTEAAICGECKQYFGEALGHSFTKYEPVSVNKAGCEHNPVTVAICDNNCGEENYDYSALTNLKVTQEAVDPTCTEKGSTAEKICTECDAIIVESEVVPALGHDFGEIVVEKEPNYGYTGKGKHTCGVCGITEEVVIPAKAFNPSTLAILNADYDNPDQYKTIQDAVAAAQDGDTIILVKDGSVKGNITLDKEIVLDLAGHTLDASTDSVSFETAKNFEIRSTVLGLGERYTGLVEIPPSTEEDTYGTIADVPNGDLYVMGHYSSTGKLEAYENRIANKKLIAVDSSRSYIFKTGCDIQFSIREFNNKGRFIKSVGGIANGATYTPSGSSVAYIGVSFWINGDSTTDIMAMMQNGEFVPTISIVPVKATVNFSKPFVKTSAQFKMSNIKAVSAANTTFVESSSADVAAPAKFIAKDSEFAALKKTGSDGRVTEVAAIPLKFTANAIELDIQDSTIRSTTGNGLEINSAGAFGTIKNTKITKNSGNAINVSKTADAGIVFDGCSISQGAWDTTAARVSGGKVTFTGGTAISGSNMASTVLNVSGGTITLDGVTLSGDKGTDANRRLLYFSGSPNVIIKKATFTKGTSNGTNGVITNDLEKFISCLAEGSTFFNSETMNGNTAMKGDAITATDMTVCVGECGHWERSVSKAETCTVAHTCNFCAMAFESLGHDYSTYDSDEATHWRICTRCKAIDPEDNVPEAHFGGTATCDEPAECEVCGEYYGKALGHLFPEANADGSYDKEHYTFDEDNHWVSCTREECDAIKEGTNIAHNGGTTTCEEKAVCKDCGQEYGPEPSHKSTGWIITREPTETQYGFKYEKCHICKKILATQKLPKIVLKNLSEEWNGEDIACYDSGVTFAGSHQLIKAQ
ncbi:MAG: leucine-rich repeat protein, partial [Clostridia bacterium]|nr:leucine-rich repeat protein [Clostridia bacterium]